MLKSLLLAALVAPAGASQFSRSEIQAARLRDRVRAIQDTLRENGDARRKLDARVAAAFEGEQDRARAVAAYEALARPLEKRAAAAEAQLDKAMSSNDFDRDLDKELEKVSDAMRSLGSDFDFYVRLPELAATLQRPAAVPTMRVLAQSGGVYPVARAFFDTRTVAPAPFAAAAGRAPMMRRSR